MKAFWIVLGSLITALIALVILNGVGVFASTPAKPKLKPIPLTMTWDQFNQLKRNEPSTVIQKFIPAVLKDRDSNNETIIPSADGLGYFYLLWESRDKPSDTSNGDDVPTGQFLFRKTYYAK